MSRTPHSEAQALRHRNDARLAAADFDLAPFTLAWEITRACALACLPSHACVAHTR
ncbi:hypothetical protein LCGC14_3012630 [marine sediment metagenome]|uniref:Uncharacterized protein n=1 Tax=marine sediment metagenome TaxID=412755 RepID=A0A0F8WY68_9ZZZZ